MEAFADDREATEPVQPRGQFAWERRDEWLAVARLGVQLALLINILVTHRLRPNQTVAADLLGALFIVTNLVWVAPVRSMRWRPIERYFFAAELMAVLLLDWTLFSGVSEALWFPPLAALPAVLSIDASLLWVALYLGAWIVGVLFREISTLALAFAEAAIALYGVLVSGALRRARVSADRLRERLSERAQAATSWEMERRQLRAFAEDVHRVAALEERARLAGELHDSVAHHMTALIVQLQVAIRAGDQGDRTADQALATGLDLARTSLDSLRAAVRVSHLNRPQSERFDLLERLALEYASLTGLSVDFSVAPALSVPPAPVLAQLYRCVQELMTNAKRHGHATAVAIRLFREGYEAVLEVDDDGQGSDRIEPGFGLTSMNERLSVFGGTLTIRSQAGCGCQVRVKLPLWSAKEES